MSEQKKIIPGIQNPGGEVVMNEADLGQVPEGVGAESPEPEFENAPQSVDDAGELRAQLELSQQELVDAQDKMVRALAEAQNARRRAEKEVANARLYSLDKFARDLLPVIDNLERALDSVSEDAMGGPFYEGVELTLKSFIDVLKRFGVEQCNPVGEPFDPQFHQAISMVDNKELEPDSVLNVVQKGYTLNGRLVRPAMVVVSQ